MSIKVIRVKKAPYCRFYDQPCLLEKCAAFLLQRAMTREECQGYWVQDIPITDYNVSHWCMRYNKSVRPIIEIQEVPDTEN